MDWDERAIVLSVDGERLNEVHLSRTINQDGSAANPFHQPQYLLLNLAVGGTQGGDPSETTFPARFEVDYVRVYQATDRRPLSRRLDGWTLDTGRLSALMEARMNSHTDDKYGAVGLTAKTARHAPGRRFRLRGAMARRRRARRWVAAVLALLFVVPALAQEASPFRGSRSLRVWLCLSGQPAQGSFYERSRRLFAAGDAQRDGIGTVEAVRQRQENIRRVVIASFGGLPSADTPLNARVTGTVQGDGFRIEKIIFESRPRHYVTANLYLPMNRPAGRTAAVLFLSGPSRHSESGAGIPERLPDPRAGGTDRARAGSGGAGRTVELLRT